MEVAVKMETIGMNQPEETVLLGTIFVSIKVCFANVLQAGSLWYAGMSIRIVLDKSTH